MAGAGVIRNQVSVRVQGLTDRGYWCQSGQHRASDPGWKKKKKAEKMLPVPELTKDPQNLWNPSALKTGPGAYWTANQGSAKSFSRWLLPGGPGWLCKALGQVGVRLPKIWAYSKSAAELSLYSDCLNSITEKQPEFKIKSFGSSEAAGALLRGQSALKQKQPCPWVRLVPSGTSERVHSNKQWASV